MAKKRGMIKAKPIQLRASRARLRAKAKAKENRKKAVPLAKRKPQSVWFYGLFHGFRFFARTGMAQELNEVTLKPTGVGSQPEDFVDLVGEEVLVTVEPSGHHGDHMRRTQTERGLLGRAMDAIAREAISASSSCLAPNPTDVHLLEWRLRYMESMLMGADADLSDIHDAEISFLRWSGHPTPDRDACAAALEAVQ